MAIRRALFLGSWLLASCARSPLPPHALPTGVHVTPPHGGRWAMVLETEHTGGCSMSSFVSSSRASIVLSLADDGGAVGCRGRRWISTMTSNEGEPRPDVTELVEQQGMRGTWRTVGDALRIDLALDDGVCAPMRNAKSEEARPWSLECVAIASASPGESEPPFPAMACRFSPHDDGSVEDDYPHDVGYTVAESFAFFGRSTIFLAPDPGVIIEEQAHGGMDPNGIRTWSKPTTPIAFDAWSAGAE
jgi:hypothetical protein